MNRLAIRNLCRKKLGETTEAFWSDDEIDGWINLACKDLAKRSKCLKTNGYFTTSSVSSNTVGTVASEWTLTSIFSDIISVLSVYFHTDGENWERIPQINYDDLDSLYPNWRDSVGRVYTSTAGVVTYNYECVPSSPMHYYYDSEENIFGLWPPCDSDNGTSNNVRIYYAKTHTDLGSDLESPTIPSDLQLAIIDFVCATGFGTRGWGDKEDNAWGKYFAKINDYVTERKREREDEEIIMKPERNL